jgi:hypothetical protein
MRFVILVAGAAITSAVAVVSFKTVFPQQNAMLAATARAAMTNLARFDLSALNPVRSAYDHVATEVASPKPIPGLNFQSTVGEIKMVPMTGISPLNVGGGFASPTNSPPWHGPVRR